MTEKKINKVGKLDSILEKIEKTNMISLLEMKLHMKKIHEIG